MSLWYHKGASPRPRTSTRVAGPVVIALFHHSASADSNESTAGEPRKPEWKGR
jgi:hypothetical protein